MVARAVQHCRSLVYILFVFNTNDTKKQKGQYQVTAFVAKSREQHVEIAASSVFTCKQTKIYGHDAGNKRPAKKWVVRAVFKSQRPFTVWLVGIPLMDCDSPIFSLYWMILIRIPKLINKLQGGLCWGSGSNVARSIAVVPCSCVVDSERWTRNDKGAVI